jgi:uncharacterized coiled-coil protein SlyX
MNNVNNKINNIYTTNKFNNTNNHVANNTNNVDNLDIYIPRISASETEDSIKEVFFKFYIGVVDYADIVATKNPDTKEVQYYSAFVRLSYWGPNRYPMEVFNSTRSYKIMFPNTNGENESYWILLPNKNPLPRTKVNVHQLAASTEKLFEQLEVAEKQLVNKTEEIKELTACVSRQNDVIEELNFQLLSERENTNARFEEMMYLIKDLQSQLKYNTNILDKIDDEPVMKQVETPCNKTAKIAEKQEPEELFNRLTIADEDDCIYSTPIRRTTMYSFNKESREEQIKSYEQSKKYKTPKVNREKSLSPPSFDDMVRMSISRDFCGNY